MFYWFSGYYRYKSQEIGNKIPDIINLTAKAALNTKATENESKIPDITNLQSPAKSSRLAHKLLNNTRLNILGNEEILEKSQN